MFSYFYVVFVDCCSKNGLTSVVKLYLVQLKKWLKTRQGSLKVNTEYHYVVLKAYEDS